MRYNNSAIHIAHKQKSKSKAAKSKGIACYISTTWLAGWLAGWLVGCREIAMVKVVTTAKGTIIKTSRYDVDEEE